MRNGWIGSVKPPFTYQNLLYFTLFVYLCPLFEKDGLEKATWFWTIYSCREEDMIHTSVQFLGLRLASTQIWLWIFWYQISLRSLLGNSVSMTPKVRTINYSLKSVDLLLTFLPLHKLWCNKTQGTIFLINLHFSNCSKRKWVWWSLR